MTVSADRAVHEPSLPAVANAVQEGARRLAGERWIVLLLYAATGAFALAATGMTIGIAAASLAHSALAAQMADNFDVEWISELMAAHGGLLAAPWPAAILGGGALFAALYLFFLGGVVEVLGAGRPDFFAGCGRHFWRLARLSVWSGIVCIAVLAAAGAVGGIGRKLWGDGSEAAPLIYWNWLRLAVMFGGLALANAAFEYAALGMAIEDSRRSLGALLAAFRFLAQRPVRTLGLYAALTLILLVPVLGGFAISRAAAPASIPAVVILFVVRQAAVLAKTWTWLLFFPAQAAMWEALHPAQEMAPTPAAEYVIATPEAPLPPAEKPPDRDTAPLA